MAPGKNKKETVMKFYEFDTRSGHRIRFSEIGWYGTEERDGRPVNEIDSCVCEWEDLKGEWRRMPKALARVYGRAFEDEIKERMRRQ